MNDFKKDCLIKIINLHKEANSGHIGSSLSCLDILVYLYVYRMSEFDKFILSKGHAASAFYTVLAKSGKFPEEQLNTFYKDATLLAAHPPCNNKLNGVLFGTGSLGHGLGIAVGLAISSKYTKKDFNVYCIVSDGECNEGSIWEAIMFAAHHHLINLYVIVDKNGLQGFGETKTVINMDPLEKKWESFGFEVANCNGNSFQELHNAFGELENKNTNKPKCIIAYTTKGNGISFMENRLEWHYLPMNSEQYNLALKEANG